MRWLVRFSTSTPPLRPPHGILGTHPREHSELTPNVGRPTPGRTLASPSPPGRLPGGPGAARDRSSDLVMPRLPVSTRSTGQGICLARSRRVVCRTSLRTVQALRYRPVVLRTHICPLPPASLKSVVAGIRLGRAPSPGRVHPSSFCESSRAHELSTVSWTSVISSAALGVIRHLWVPEMMCLPSGTVRAVSGE